jgi:5-methylcytosine-specific restriction endonuclease McrA
MPSLIRHEVGRDGKAWRQVRAEVLAVATNCGICHQRIDFDAPPRSRWSPSVDHIVSLHDTTDLDPAERRRLALDRRNLRAVHYSCNSRRGAMPTYTEQALFGDDS